MIEITTETVHGRQVIGSSDLVYYNSKYRSPYLAVLGSKGEMVWQDRVYLGYGKRVTVYYVVEDLQPGDLIQCAGGSAGNKYPFKGRVIERTSETLVVEPLDDKAWSNLRAARKKDA